MTPRIGIKPAERIGVSAFRAARVKQEIVKIPENEIVVALGRPEAAVAGVVDLEQDPAIHEQGEQGELRENHPAVGAVLLAEVWTVGRWRRDVRIADPEQRAGARRFQHHLVAAPPHIGKARQDKDVAIAERRRCRPIIGDLRLDDNLVFSVAPSPDAVLHETVPGESRTKRSVSRSTARRPLGKCGERQTCAQHLRARAPRSALNIPRPTE